MSTLDPFKFTLSEVSRLIHSNELSPNELLESLLQRIDELEPRLKAWVSLDRQGAKKTANECSREAEKKCFRGLLHGIPVGIKDIYFTAGMRTTAGSKILADFIPSCDATTVARLREAGAVILGKTETTEFAVFDPAPTRNPWNTAHTPGGSSSGSAAAVSSGMCPAALGSQTGGSTIRPAAYCGIIGLKPTYGRISRYGIIPVSWSLDHAGIFTRTVEDAAILLEVLAGHDSKDPTSSSQPVSPYRRAVESSSLPRLGLLREFFWDNANDQVKKNIDKAAKVLGNAGAEITETALPKCFNVADSARRIVMETEIAAYHEETFRTRMMDYRPFLRRSIASGLLIPAVSYLKAQRIRSQFIREISASLKEFDCFLTPATTTPAPKGLESTGDPAFNWPWSFCGFPSITVPSAVTDNDLPLGIQLVGRPFDEERVLSIASWCEKVIGFGHEPHNPK
jgi:aspartyl-tRNA(Asn)/glutamyl-tRNA(Gln) amidotransferase subunit A